MLARSFMSRVLVVVLVMSAGSAWAEKPSDSEAREPVKTPRIAVSAIMGEVGQALIWDADQGEYVVLRVGSWIQGFRVRAIFPEQVVIEGNHPGQHFVFALGPRDQLNRDLRNPSQVPVNRGHSATAAPLDPYAPAKIIEPKGPVPSVLAPRRSRADAIVKQTPIDPFGASSSEPSAKKAAPMDPYAPEAPAAKKTAPVDPYAPEAPSAKKTDSVSNPFVQSKPLSPVDPYDAIAAPAPKAETGAEGPMDPYQSLGARVAKVPTTVVRSKPTRRKKVRVSRRAFDTALKDFHRLSKEVQLEAASPEGFRVAGLKRGSFFHKAGLRKGDIVVQVAGIPLRSIDDAATIYANVASSDRFEALVKRRGKDLTLEVQFSRR